VLLFISSVELGLPFCLSPVCVNVYLCGCVKGQCVGVATYLIDPVRKSCKREY